MEIILPPGWDDIPERVFKVVDAFTAKGDGSEFLIELIRAVGHLR